MDPEYDPAGQAVDEVAPAGETGGDVGQARRFQAHADAVCFEKRWQGEGGGRF